jgi:hypothetical protein
VSRQSRITESLESLKRLGAIQDYHQEHSPSEPTRHRWLILVSSHCSPGQYRRAAIQQSYMSTGEVEAFIAGADAVVRVPGAEVPPWFRCRVT